MKDNFKLILIAHAALSMVDMDKLPHGGLFEDWIVTAQGGISATVKLWPAEKKHDG